MIDTIVFDLGGVLAHLSHERAVRRFQSLGISEAPELLDPYLQKGSFLMVEDGRMSSEEFVEDLSLRAGRKLSYEEVSWAYLGFIVDVPQYKFDYIDQLREEYKIYLLSNTNPFIMDYAESDRFLPNKRPLSSYIERKFASCQMGYVKPDERIFLEMISESGLEPEKTLFIDDGPRNIEVASRLGFVTYQAANFEDWRWPISQLLRASKGLPIE